MKALLIIVFGCCTNAVFAQQLPTSLQLARENRLSNLSINKPIDNMPISRVGDLNQTFILNNGKGLDIYQSQPDNMPIAKPDGSFIDNMSLNKFDPTLLNIINSNKANQFKPKGNSKYNFVLPSHQDFLPFIDSTEKLFKIK